MTTDSRSEAPRVVVAFDAAAHSAGVLDAAARLAAGLGAELVGLSMADKDLMSAAVLPVSRIVSSYGLAPTVFDAPLMERALRIWSAQARGALEEAARRWHVKWSYRIVQETEQEQVLAQLRSSDLLTFAVCRRQHDVWNAGVTSVVTSRSRCSVFWLRQERVVARPVVVLDQGGEVALKLGRTVAAAYAAPLVVVMLRDGQPAGPEDEKRIGRVLEEFVGRLALADLPAATAGQVAQVLRQHQAGLVVFDRRGPYVAQIESALETVPCSVLSIG